MSEEVKSKIIQVQILASPEKEENARGKEKRRWLWGILFFAAVFVTLFTTSSYKMFLFPRIPLRADCTSFVKGLFIYVSYPAFISNGDTGEIFVTVNNANTPIDGFPIKDQVVTSDVVLDFEDPSLVQFDSETSNVLSSYELLPGEQHTKKILFTVNNRAQIFDFNTPPLSFSVREANTGKLCKMEGEGKISVAYLYRLHTLVTTAMKFGVGTFLISIVVASWEKLKKILFKL